MQRLAPKKTRKEQSINDHPIRGPEGRLFTSQLQLKFRALSERNSWLEVSRAVTPTSGAVTSTPSTSKPRQKQTSNKLPLQERCKTNARSAVSPRSEIALYLIIFLLKAILLLVGKLLPLFLVYKLLP
nr:uncharacterized protein LOC105465699 [Macaca nemestrina]